MTYTYPPAPDHADDGCTDPTCRTLEEWIALISADLDTTGHQGVAEQVRTARTDVDLADAGDHLDAIAGAVADSDLHDRLSKHVRMLRRLTGNAGHCSDCPNHAEHADTAHAMGA